MRRFIAAAARRIGLDPYQDTTNTEETTMTAPMPSPEMFRPIYSPAPVVPPVRVPAASTRPTPRTVARNREVKAAADRTYDLVRLIKGYPDALKDGPRYGEHHRERIEKVTGDVLGLIDQLIDTDRAEYEKLTGQRPATEPTIPASLYEQIAREGEDD